MIPTMGEFANWPCPQCGNNFSLVSIEFTEQNSPHWTYKLVCTNPACGEFHKIATETSAKELVIEEMKD